MKKTVFTLNVDGYSKEITDLTYPFLRHYAHKIGADFHIINTRKFPDYPPVYEKLQIYKLGQQMQNDWNIFFDADALIHPDLFDVTNHLSKDTVLHNGHDIADNRWRYDQYFLRDGRHIGSCNWFAVASDWCLDLWHPLEDLTIEEAVQNIFPIANELKAGIDSLHLLDDYTLSRNIARYGLKFTSMVEVKQALGDQGNYFWHEYTIPLAQKIINLKQTIKDWDIVEFLPHKLQAQFTGLLTTKEKEQKGV